VQFTSSVAGKYYYGVVNSGAAEPAIATTGTGSACTAGANNITAYMTSGAKDLYIKVKDTDGNVSDMLKISIPAFSASAQTSGPMPEATVETTPAPTPTPDPAPDFNNIKITGGTVLYLNPDFAGITITFGNGQ
jgi:hypothetical protein